MIAANTWIHRRLRFSHSRIEKSTLLAPSIRCVSVRAQQQWDVKSRFSLTHLERHLDHRVESRNLEPAEVAPGIEYQTIKAWQKFSRRQQFEAPAIVVRARRRDRLPPPRRILLLDSHRHPGSRHAAG